MDEIKEHKQTLIGIAILTIVIVGLLAFLQKSTATITLTVQEPNARVYLNNEAYTQTNRPNEEIEMSLKEGSHSVLVAKDNHWPWKKDITITDTARDKHWNVFTLPKQAPATRVELDSQDYNDIQSKFITGTLPTEKSPIVSESEQISAWTNASGTTVYAEQNESSNTLPAFCSQDGCKDTITSFTTDQPIRYISFFDGYSDLVVYAAGDTLALREIDPDGTQNVQPIYTGSAPTFRHGTGTIIHLRQEDGELINISL